MSGETESSVSGWTTDTLHAHLAGRLTDLRDMLDERYRTQTKALDAAFDAQQIAMQVAMTAAEKAVAAALAASEKAVTKAEIATDKRIEGLNELRQIVNDITAIQMPRAEAEQRLGQIAEQLNEVKVLASASGGRSAGLNAGWAYLVSAVGGIAAMVAIVIALANRH
jgi:hypothetical protein